MDPMTMNEKQTGIHLGDANRARGGADREELRSSSDERSPHPRGLHGTIQRYLSDLIYGANDGIVTTLAIVSGVVGAGLPTSIILILGFANVVADGFSMGASNYLSKRTTVKAADCPPRRQAARHGSATFLGFVVAGTMPLLAYLIPGLTADRFVIAVLLALVALFVVGASRAFFTELRWFRAGAEMFLIGALAAAVAFGIGALGAWLTGGLDGAF
jgi:vacuolar iron transporter family protein